MWLGVSNRSINSAPATAPGSLSPVNPSQSTLDISWTASTSVSGLAIVGYNLERALSASGPWTPILQQSGLTYTDTNLNASTTYYYRVNAYDTSGLLSPYSNIANAATSAPAGGAAPVILYTDIVAGPTSGGENNLGCYLSIFGINFGAQGDLGTNTKVYVGSAEVANYRALVAGKTAAKFNPPIQQIIVQVGSLGGLAAGASGNIRVNVNSVDSNTNNTFMNQPGPIFFADETNGNDANAGTIAAPYQHLQTPSGRCAMRSNGSNNATPGTYVVLRGGSWSGIGLNNRWCQFYLFSGTAPTGAANQGYLTITAYPGPILGHAPEVVSYLCPSGQKGGIHGSNDNVAQYWAISNLSIACNPTVTEGPTNLQSDSHHARIVNMELGPWQATNAATAGGCAGNGNGVKLLGNYIHDITGTQGETHGIYFDGSNNVAINCECAYNYIIAMHGGSGWQCFNGSGPANPFTNMSLHHNWIEDTAKYAANMGQSVGGSSAVIYDNVFVHNALYAFRAGDTSGSVQYSVVNNTIYDFHYPSGGGNAAVLNEGSFTGGYIEIKNNVICMGASRSNNGLTWFSDQGGSSAAYAWANNLYYDPQAHTTTKYSGDTTGVYGNPIFATPYTDLRVQIGSPAINTGTTNTQFAPSVDFDNDPRPKPGNANPTIGAFESP